MSEHTLIPAATQQAISALPNHKAFMGFVISRPGQSLNRWKTITQAVNRCCICSHMLSRFSKQHSIHRFSTKSKKVSICDTSANGSLLVHQHTSIPCPSAAVALCKAAQQRVYPELITFELGVKCLLRLGRASQGEAPTLWFCCFSSSHSGWGWKHCVCTLTHTRTHT